MGDDKPSVDGNAIRTKLGLQPINYDDFYNDEWFGLTEKPTADEQQAAYQERQQLLAPSKHTQSVPKMKQSTLAKARTSTLRNFLDDALLVQDGAADKKARARYRKYTSQGWTVKKVRARLKTLERDEQL